MKHSLFILLLLIGGVCMGQKKEIPSTAIISGSNSITLPATSIIFSSSHSNDSLLGKKDTIAIQMIVTGHDAGSLSLVGEPVYLIRGYAFRHWAYCFETIDRGFGGASDYQCCPFTDGYLDENKKPLPKYYTIWLTK